MARPWHKVLAGSAVLAAFVFTLARTLRGPNDWAEAHWLLDYRFGFVKRGLAGQLLTWLAGLFGVPVTEGLVAVAAFTVLAGFCALLLGMALRVLRAADWQPAVVAAVVAFATSPFVVMTGHLAGYLDHVILPLGIASVWCAMRGASWTGAALQCVALLVHESATATVYPLFVLAALLREAPREDARRVLLWPLLAPIVMTAVMVLVLATPPAAFLERFNERLKSFPFVAGGFEQQTAAMLVLKPAEAWALIGPHYAERMSRASSFGLVLPTVAALLVALAQRARVVAWSIEAVLVAAALLLPQAMHVIAWDLERIWTYSIFTAFAAVWVYARQPARAAGAPGLFAIACAAIAANLLMVTPLLDLEVDRMPFAARVGMLAVLLGVLTWLETAPPAAPWRERWFLHGRSVWQILRGRPRP